MAVLPTCPSISGTVNSTTLTTVYGTASTEKICTVSGTGLLAGITVTPPTGYEVSLTSGGIFTQSVTAGSAGNVTNIPVYMRLSTAAIPGVYAGNVVLSSLGVTNLNVTNSADTVKQKPLTISGITANNKIFDKIFVEEGLQVNDLKTTHNRCKTYINRYKHTK